MRRQSHDALRSRAGARRRGAKTDDPPACELRAEALCAQNGRAAAYFLGMPLLADYLEEGLAQFGRSCGDFEAENLSG
ncbi:DUF3775 domain-containing protein [Methylocella sp.]|uniref:DUF3775 domain-containing protein n=1 Tax=Methylocella sp. TaxID=1978226 RepID=UPI00378396F2